MNFDEFFGKFAFKASGAGLVGVEREQFVIDPETNEIVPHAARYLSHIEGLGGAIHHMKYQFGYELSACQIESKIGPCSLDRIEEQLNQSEQFLSSVDGKLSLGRLNLEVAPRDVPLDIYPDPTGRYQKITQRMDKDVLKAACRVAATHIHIGMPDIDTAIKSYNRSIESLDTLIRMGDHSKGQRMSLYPLMAKRHLPEIILSPKDFFEQAVTFGYDEDPRKCWTLIRISVHGTLEFRMFGATDSIPEIMEWVKQCHKLCS